MVGVHALVHWKPVDNRRYCQSRCSKKTSAHHQFGCRFEFHLAVDGPHASDLGLGPARVFDGPSLYP